MNNTSDQEERPANIGEFLERSSDDLAKSVRGSWFQMCACVLFIAALSKGAAVAQMLGIPDDIVFLFGCAPYVLYTIVGWRELKERKAKIKAETVRRELEEKATPQPLPTLPITSRSTVPYPTTEHILKLLAFVMVRALWSAEFLSFLLLVATIEMGEYLARISGIPIFIIFAVGFAPAALYTFDLLWSQRKLRTGRDAVRDVGNET